MNRNIRETDMTVRRIVVISLACVLCGCLAGCTDSPEEQISSDESAAPEEKITLQFQQWWENELPENVLDEICQQFSRETGIDIELVSGSRDEIKEAVEAGAAAGNMADIVSMDSSMVYDLTKQGTISNLTELMEYDMYDTDQLKGQVQIDGSTYMIPVIGTVYPLYVNVEVLQQAGVYKIPATWTDFTQACQAVKDNTDLQGCMFQTESETAFYIGETILPWLWASGGRLVEENQLKLEENQEAEHTAEYIKSLFDDACAVCFAESDEDFVARFVNGEAAFMVPAADSSKVQELCQSMDEKVQAVLFPVPDEYEGKSRIGVNCWGISIASNCEYQREAMQFLEYLMSPGINNQLAEYAGAYSCNTDAGPTDTESGSLNLECRELFRTCQPVMETAEISMDDKMREQISTQLYAYFMSDTLTAQEFLKNVQEQWNELYQ